MGRFQGDGRQITGDDLDQALPGIRRKKGPPRSVHLVQIQVNHKHGGCTSLGVAAPAGDDVDQGLHVGAVVDIHQSVLWFHG